MVLYFRKNLSVHANTSLDSLQPRKKYKTFLSAFSTTQADAWEGDTRFTKIEKKEKSDRETKVGELKKVGEVAEEVRKIKEKGIDAMNEWWHRKFGGREKKERRGDGEEKKVEKRKKFDPKKKEAKFGFKKLGEEVKSPKKDVKSRAEEKKETKKTKFGFEKKRKRKEDEMDNLNLDTQVDWDVVEVFGEEVAEPFSQKYKYGYPGLGDLAEMEPEEKISVPEVGAGSNNDMEEEYQLLDDYTLLCLQYVAPRDLFRYVVLSLSLV